MATNRKASARSAKSMKPAANRPVSFEQAALLCPTQGQAERVAEKFGLTVPDYQAIRELHARALDDMADGLACALNDKATQMHFQRIVGSLVSSAVGAGRFYSEKVSEARAAAARAADGGEEHGAPVGFEFRALRVAEFAADMAMQAYALLAAAHGAVEAFKEITGDDWVAYQAHDDAPGPAPAALAQDPALGLRRRLSDPRRGPSGPLPSNLAAGTPKCPSLSAALRQNGNRFDLALPPGDDSTFRVERQRLRRAGRPRDRGPLLLVAMADCVLSFPPHGHPPKALERSVAGNSHD